MSTSTSKCILGSSHRTVANTPRISQKCSCHNPPQIPIKCGSVEVTQLHPCMWRGFQALPGRSRGSRGLQGAPCFERKMRPAAYCQSLEPWARLKFHAGCVSAGGVLKGSERPEAGCLGEYDQGFWVQHAGSANMRRSAPEVYVLWLKFINGGAI